MTTFQNPRVIEHLATKADLSLEEFCERLGAGLKLPEFEYDAENETQWGLAQIGALEINVSRPYTAGTLQSWDSSTPDGCNYAVSLIVAESAPPGQNEEWAGKELAPPYAQMIANSIGCDVYHHSGWSRGKLGPRTLAIYRPTKR